MLRPLLILALLASLVFCGDVEAKIKRSSKARRDFMRQSGYPRTRR